MKEIYELKGAACSIREIARELDVSRNLDFVHLGGVGEDVGELSVNCGWGVFSCRVSNPRLCTKAR